MAVATTYILRMYRVAPGDIGVLDTVIIPINGTLDKAEIEAAESLKKNSMNADVPASHRPHHADVLSSDGQTVLLTLMMDGPDKVSKVPNAEGH